MYLIFFFFFFFGFNVYTSLFIYVHYSILVSQTLMCFLIMIVIDDEVIPYGIIVSLYVL